MGTAEQHDANNGLQQTTVQPTSQDFADQQQYLTFLMQDEEYVIDILNVQ